MIILYLIVNHASKNPPDGLVVGLSVVRERLGQFVEKRDEFLGQSGEKAVIGSLYCLQSQL